MTLTQQIIMIGVVVLGTMVTRFLPFLIFPQGKTPPKFVQYLGTVLPTAVIGLLVVYGLKDAPVSATHGLPEAIAIAAIYVLHRWKKSTLLTWRRDAGVYAAGAVGVLRNVWFYIGETELVSSAFFSVWRGMGN